MDDANEQRPVEDPNAPAPAPPQDHAPSAGAAITPEEIEAGKVFAILCYALGFIVLPFWILPLVMRDNEFSLFHAKQALMLWLTGLVGYSVAAVTTFLCIGFLLFPVVVVGMLVLSIMGLLYAAQGQAKPVPVVGPLAVQWFAGIRKQAEPGVGA